MGAEVRVQLTPAAGGGGLRALPVVAVVDSGTRMDQHPDTPALVVEVADTSAGRDLVAKARYGADRAPMR